MAKPTGFLEIQRRDRPYEKPEIRRRSWKEFVQPLPEPDTRKQAARCMDCGIPFCHVGGAIVDRGWQEGWITPVMPARRSGKRVAVIGSGPAGLACAQQLARAGHS